jgi:1-acyl-sn-glycerol-3-phosphate acyltransferase
MADRTYRCVIAVCRLVFRALKLRIEVRGAELLPRSGSAIIACNHLSYLDFTFVGLAATKVDRRIRFMAKKSVFDSRISGRLMRAMNHIPVDRDSGAAAYRQASRKLGQGELVGIFPEATISRAWTLKPFKLGAATLAVKEQLPLYPVVVWGAQRILTVGGRWSVRRGKAISVFVGPPITPGASVAAVDAELRSRMQELLDRAQREYPDQPRDAEDDWWLPAHLGGSAPSPELAQLQDVAGIRTRAV